MYSAVVLFSRAFQTFLKALVTVFLRMHPWGKTPYSECLAFTSRAFGLNPLNNLFENIVWLRAHNQVFFGEDQRGHTIQSVLACQVYIGRHLGIEFGILQAR